MLDPRHVTPDMLPASVRELVDVVGLPAALAIVSLRGGIKLVVPTRATPDHWLAPHIGAEALEALVEHYHGEEIEIPRCMRTLVLMRHRAILEARDAGLSQAETAQAHGTTERNVRLLEARYGRGVDERQGGLF